MNFWSVKNVQKYYNWINPSFINLQEILCCAAIEILRVHYLKCIKGARYMILCVGLCLQINISIKDFNVDIYIQAFELFFY